MKPTGNTLLVWAMLTFVPLASRASLFSSISTTSMFPSQQFSGSFLTRHLPTFLASDTRQTPAQPRQQLAQRVSKSRRILADDEGGGLVIDEDDGDDVNVGDRDKDNVRVTGFSVPELKRRIAAHKLKISRLRRETKDLSHEKDFLRKDIELKKGQTKMQDGQVKLSQAELEDKEREIAMYKREAPKTLSKYNELVRAQKELQGTLNRLHLESQELKSSKMDIMAKIQNLNMDDLIERHARGLPEAMAGALRKSAAAIVPFFDYLAIAADTNNRLVDHVGTEIDRYTHVNIGGSPFLSGLLYYCVLLIPLLTIISFVRRVFDSSSKLTVSHYIIFGNLYFVLICAVNIIAALMLHRDPSYFLFQQFEHSFVVANLLLAMYYFWHTLMLALQTIFSLDLQNISQLVATLSVGAHYFLFTWRRVFTDVAPTMYTANYLIYGTIFSFILYDRFNRMSTQQLCESMILGLWVTFRSGKLSSTIHSLSIRSVHKTATEYWASWFGRTDPSPTRYSKREDRRLTSEKDKTKRAGGRSHRSAKRVPIDSDDESIVEERYRRKDAARRVHRGRSKSRSPKRGHAPAESRGFVSIFFGSKEEENEDSESSESEIENEDSNTGGGWRFFRRGDSGNVSTRRHSATAEMLRAGAANRSEKRGRDRREVRQTRSSFWKWS